MARYDDIDSPEDQFCDYAATFAGWNGSGRDITHLAVGILEYLVYEHLDPKGTFRFPSHASIAAGVGCDPKTVARSLEGLEAVGLLTRSTAAGVTTGFIDIKARVAKPIVPKLPKSLTPDG